ncbi:uncharacterized protein LOC118437717 [Folsomia candida]|uniref:uncharacterized protein LOC118437717 n=1 Tax=Folsomia candida TaxID=158441 RepID=UPI0016050519|nr:uncharacterized protein LOC118437717 [Folsomia candida]
MEEHTTYFDPDFEPWLANKGHVTSLHFLWACHGLRSLLRTTGSGGPGLGNLPRLIVRIYHEWIVPPSGLNLSKETLRTTISYLLRLGPPSLTNLEEHVAILEEIEGHVHSNLRSEFIPQFQKKKSRRDKKVPNFGGGDLLINGRDDLGTPNVPCRPPQPPELKPAQFFEQVASRLKILALSSPPTNGEGEEISNISHQQ